LEASRREGKPTFSYWDDVANDDKYWNLVDVMKKVAEKKGMYIYIMCNIKALDM